MSAVKDDDARSAILVDIKGVLDAIKLQLNPKKKSKGPIASNTLKITTQSGFGALGTAAAGAVTAIIGAATGQSDAVIIAALAFAAVALLAVAAIVVSDHRARSSAYATLEGSLPALIAAAGTLTTPTNAAPGQAGPISYVVPVHEGVRVRLSRAGDQIYEVLAIRVDIDPASPRTDTPNSKPWYLIGQIGGDPPVWRQVTDGGLMAGQTKSTG